MGSSLTAIGKKGSKRQFAEDCFHELVGMGFSRKVASRIMAEASPSQARKAADWAIQIWTSVGDSIADKGEEPTEELVRNTLDCLLQGARRDFDLYGTFGKIKILIGQIEHSFKCNGLSVPDVTLTELKCMISGAIEAIQGLPLT